MNSTPFGFKLIFGVFCVVILVANSVEAVKQGEDLMTILAKERKATLKIVQREDQRLRQENKQLRQEAKQLRQKDEQLHSKLDKLHKEIARLQHRQADSEIQASLRQKDQLQNGTRSALDLDDHVKKVCNSEIINFMTNEKVCVGGTLGGYEQDKFNQEKTVQFGYEFVRKPTVSASLSHLDVFGTSNGALAVVSSISKSSAVISVNTAGAACTVAWLACL